MTIVVEIVQICRKRLKGWRNTVTAAGTMAAKGIVDRRWMIVDYVIPNAQTNTHVFPDRLIRAAGMMEKGASAPFFLIRESLLFEY